MKKFICAVVIFGMILSVTLSAQAAGGAAGGMGGGRGGGMGAGGGPGGGMGMMGGGRSVAATQRPDKATRLAAIADIEKQLTALKEAINKSQAKDPCTATLTGEALTTFTAQYTEESDALTQIVNALMTIRPAAGGGRGGMMGGVGLSTEQITQLTTLAKDEKAVKTVTKLEALAKEAEAAASRGGGNRGGGGGRTANTPPPGGFKYED